MTSLTTDSSGFRLSFQQTDAWHRGGDPLCGARAVFQMPFGMTSADVRPVLNAIVQRHEILRTRVATVSGVPLQFIDDAATVHWQLAEAAELDALFQASLPEGAPLAAAWVDDASPRGAALFLAIGPLQGDAATLEVIAMELLAGLGGKPPASDPVQYADYAQWQEDQASADPAARAHWARQEIPTVGRLPLERLPLGSPGLSERLVLDRCTHSETQLLAAWAWLLARHAGQEQVTIGWVDAGRNEELHDACGPYALVLPLRLAPVAQQPWAEWCEAVSAELDRALAMRDGFANVAPDMPLQFRTAGTGTAWRALTVERPFRMRLDMERLSEAGMAAVRIVADARYFAAEALDEMAAQLRTQLQCAPAGDTTLSDMPLLHSRTAAQAAAGLVSSPVSEWADPPLLQDTIAAQALARPAHAAVVCGESTLSHGDLDQAATRLAARLVAAGAGPDKIVGVCIERSTDLIVALLGVLKSGAAYLPLDPAYPSERLAYMVKDSGAIGVVVHETTRHHAPTSVPWVDVHGPEAAVSPPAVRPHPDHLAYVIYTSGSTGRPKGVAVTHRNATHSTAAREHWYERRVRAYLLLSSVAFDSSVAGIFWTLTQGGTLVLPCEDERRDPQALARLVAHHQVSHLLALPSLYAQVLDEAPHLASLTDVIVAGEACPSLLVASHHHALPCAELFNEYGPTEVSVWSVAHRTRPGEDPVPIGTVIPFIRAHVLDDRLEPVPPGVAGELYLAGPAVTRGYLGRPDLTAERFVPNAFSGPPGERLYRTGDRVRWQPDGRIDFLGRADQQVKIRGHRIELGEIEARLLAHAGVRETAVVVIEDRPGERRIVAYVLPRGDAPSAEALRQHVSRALPDHLVPSAFVVVASFPQTPNGKLDRLALPAPEAAATAPYVAPRNLTESLIASIWSDVLDTDRIGVHDNFFELGGHSLVATQVVVRLRHSFGIDLPVRELFAAPTVAGLADLVRQQRPAAPAIPAIDAVPRDGADLPLSFAQQRLWFLAQLDPQDVSYHIPGRVRLTGPLDAEALSRAFDALLMRHEVLRTRIVVDALGRPRQVIDPEPSARLLQIDVADERQADDVALREAMTPFSLGDGPLLRFSLLHLAPERHQLVMVLHHAISDGGSTERMLEELGALYAQAIAGHAPALPPQPLQYADYAAWQHRYLTADRLASELAHWKSVLGDAQPLLALPTDRPRPAVLSGRGGHVHLRLPPELGREALAFARRHNATLFMLLEATFAALLSRCSGQSDIRIGTPVAARPTLELEPLLGLFVNTVVLRHDLHAAPNLAELLVATRHAVLDASQHAELPFERLVDAIQPERDLSHPPLFQAMFDMQTERYAALDAMPGLRGELSAIDTPTAKFDLSLSVAEKGGAIDCNFEYSTDLFDPATVERFARHFAQLLEAALREPRCPLVDLPLIGEDDASLPDHPVRERPLADGFPALFLEAAHRHASALAVVDGPVSLTYAALATRARSLAGRLQAAGARPDTPVGVLLPRSADGLVAIVACLMAGAAYLPLDPMLPSSRLQQIVAAVRPSVLVCPAEATRLWAETGIPCVTPGAATAECHAGWQPTPPHPDQLAYVIYTSGSTGTPKGAMVTQAGMLNNLLGKIEQLALTPADRIAQTASPSFDISVWQFLTALLCGASVHIVPDDITREPSALLNAVRIAHLTVLQSVPSLIRGMLDDPDAGGALPSLRWLLPTGEALPPSLAARWLQRHPTVPLLNAYGPAECADDVALWRIDTPPPAHLAQAPIGTAADNLRLHVVNEALQRQPVGVAGELVIGGVGVGRGYLGDPALTATRFVPDPFGPPGARLYRSGDLARCSVDGVLTFLGRNDHQVKVRGHRIELGEIESRLMRHPAVGGAVAVARGEPMRLVAYVVGAGDAAIDAAELRRHLAADLPEYMLPAAIVPLVQWPLNANGKIDRARLPEPDFRTDAPMGSRPPTAMEARLADVWSQVLGVSSVGPHDNFFALGGDSIVSIQVVSRARQAGLKLTARDLFQHPTLEALALVTRIDRPTTERIAPRGTSPLTPVQLAFFDQPWTGTEAIHHWNQSLLLKPARPLDKALVQAALDQLVSHHDALRMRFFPAAGGWQQRYADAEHAVLLSTQTLSADALESACNALQASLDIQKGPLLRAGLFDLDDGSQRLLLAVHHLVVDGVSWRVLLEDFGTAYRQRADGGEIRLPPRTASLQEWAEHLHSEAEGRRSAEELAYWQQQVARPLPVERPAGRHAEGEVDIVNISLDADRTARLLQSARFNARPDDILLTALARVVLAWSGQTELLVEQEGHGRPDEPDTSRTVGWFTAAYPLRLTLPSDPSPAAHVRHVKSLLRGVPRGGLGHGVLRHVHGHLPPSGAQIAFNYLGQLDAGLDGGVFSAICNRSGRLYHPDAPRQVEFDLNAYVLDGRLQLDWSHSRGRWHPGTVASLAARYRADLEAVIDSTMREGADLLTPQDFPDVALDAAMLDQLLEGME